MSEAVDPKINIHTAAVINNDGLHESKAASIKHVDVTHGWKEWVVCYGEIDDKIYY